MIKIKKELFIILTVCVLLLSAIIVIIGQKEPSNHAANVKMENNNLSNKEIIDLPAPDLKGKMPLEEAILKRRSVRSYKEAPLTLQEISQLLWSAQGITDPDRGFRAAPSAGALYPISIYLAVGNAESLEANVYQYLANEHKLAFVKKGDLREKLYQSALYQPWIKEAPLVIIIAADYDITAIKYGERAQRYVQMEAGHIAQNLYLQATSLDLGAVAVAAFDEKEIKEIIGLKEKETPLYLMPVGKQ